MRTRKSHFGIAGMGLNLLFGELSQELDFGAAPNQ